MKQFLLDFYKKMGVDDQMAQSLESITYLLIVSLIALLLWWFSKRFLGMIFLKISRSTKSKLDDYFIHNKIPETLSYFPSLFLFDSFIPTILSPFPGLVKMGGAVLSASITIVSIVLVRRLLNSLKDYLKTLKNFKDKPVDSYIQVVMIFVWFVGIMIIFSIITGKDIGTFLATLGALSAVILLIFKDTILGFVASIQVTINDTVRIGDWISMSSFNADGDVIEINLSTVKVQNFDNTITTIPTYALISDSFKNWRGMTESGGRRIKRSLNIRMSSVRHLNPNDLDRLSKVTLISKYITAKTSEIDQANSDTDKSIAINGRHLTNIGVFRKYMETYIENHSAINKDLTIMVRQLQPTTQGLPIEIYAFSSDKRWKNYEYIIADIFDHMIASVRVFDLVIYELEHSN